MADGYNSGDFIRVDIQDEGHLEKLRDDVYPNKDMPVRIKLSPTGKNVYYLTIQNKKVVSDCEKLGIIRRKSFETKYPDINSEYDKDFIRGLFDGDGCLAYIMQGTYRSYRFSIVGNYALIDDIKNKLLSLGINISFRKTKSIYELYIKGNRQIITLLNWLYDGSETSMIRKNEKYQDMIQWDLNKKILRKKI